jgi:hypothetical protein
VVGFFILTPWSAYELIDSGMPTFNQDIMLSILFLASLLNSHLLRVVCRRYPNNWSKQSSTLRLSRPSIRNPFRGWLLDEQLGLSLIAAFVLIVGGVAIAQSEKHDESEPSGIIMAIERVAVIGAGTMGAGIAQVCAQAGWKTALFDAFPEGLERGMQRIDAFWDKGIARGKPLQNKKKHGLQTSVQKQICKLQFKMQILSSKPFLKFQNSKLQSLNNSMQWLHLMQS